MPAHEAVRRCRAAKRAAPPFAAFAFRIIMRNRHGRGLTAAEFFSRGAPANVRARRQGRGLREIRFLRPLLLAPWPACPDGATV